MHEASGVRNEVIAIDGKALRRSKTKAGKGGGMLHLVTAWASPNGLTLGQVACEEKSNEIVAIPKLLGLLILKNTTVTLDAAGTQTAIAAQIRKQKGHSILAVKGNQKGLKADCWLCSRKRSTPTSRATDTPSTAKAQAAVLENNTAGPRSGAATSGRSPRTTGNGRGGRTCGRWW